MLCTLSKGTCNCSQADQLDYAIRQKNKNDATEQLANVKTKLDDVLAKLL